MLELRTYILGNLLIAGELKCLIISLLNLLIKALTSFRSNSLECLALDMGRIPLNLRQFYSVQIC